MKIIQYYLLVFSYCAMIIACSDPVSDLSTKKKSEQDLVIAYKIKSITEYQGLVHLDIAEKEKLHHVKKFDEKGKLQTATGYLEDGTIDFISTCTYDKKDRLLEKKSTKESGFFISRDLKSYDTKNRTNGNLHFEDASGPYLYGNINYLDSLGRLIKSEIFWPTGLRSVETYKYDGMNMIVNEEYDANGVFQYRWKYKYDKAGNQIEGLQYYHDSIIHAKSLCEYDKNNLLTKRTDYINESVVYQATYDYDDRFLLRSKTEYSTFGRASAKYRYVYEFYD